MRVHGESLPTISPLFVSYLILKAGSKGNMNRKGSRASKSFFALSNMSIPKYIIAHLVAKSASEVSSALSSVCPKAAARADLARLNLGQDWNRWAAVCCPLPQEHWALFRVCIEVSDVRPLLFLFLDPRAVNLLYSPRPSTYAVFWPNQSIRSDTGTGWNSELDPVRCTI